MSKMMICIITSSKTMSIKEECNQGSKYRPVLIYIAYIVSDLSYLIHDITHNIDPILLIRYVQYLIILIPINDQPIPIPIPIV